jgi:hypothetical protein
MKPYRCTGHDANCACDGSCLSRHREALKPPPYEPDEPVRDLRASILMAFAALAALGAVYLRITNGGI